jgi:hypothetical protein
VIAEQEQRKYSSRGRPECKKQREKNSETGEKDVWQVLCTHARTHQCTYAPKHVRTRNGTGLLARFYPCITARHTQSLI